MFLVVGEILYYLYANLRKIGGTPFHLAYHLQNLRVPVTLISKVGNDLEGKQIVNILEYCNITTKCVQIDNELETPVIRLTDEDLYKEESELEGLIAIDNLFSDNDMESVYSQHISCLYYNLLCQRTQTSQNTVDQIIRNTGPDCMIIGDLNSINIWNAESVIEKMLKDSAIIRLHYDTLESINELFNTHYDTHTYANYIIQEFGVEQVFTYDETGLMKIFTRNDVLSVQACRPKYNEIMNTLGVPDAFLAVYSTALCNNINTYQAIELAKEFASEITQTKGSIPENNEIYQKYNENINIITSQ